MLRSLLLKDMRQQSKDVKRRQIVEKFRIRLGRKRKNQLIKKLMLEIFQKNT
jgi:hypothetical protein